MNKNNKNKDTKQQIKINNNNLMNLKRYIKIELQKQQPIGKNELKLSDNKQILTDVDQNRNGKK